MTARLLSATMDTHTIAQGAPDFKGRGIVAFGNGKTSVGTTPAVIPGYASVGFQDETQGIASCLGFNRQPLVFDASGSGSPGLGPFLAEISGATSTIDPRMEVDAFGCGSVEVSPVGSGSTQLMAMLMLSGKTLQTKVGYTTFGGTGNHAITGVGFQPDLVLFSCFGRNAFGGPGGVVGLRALLSFGAADGSSQWAVATESNGYLSGGGRWAIVSDTKVVTSAGLALLASFVSMDADGFTLNYTNDKDAVICWMAIKDTAGQFAIGIAEANDTSITTGFQAEAVVFANTGTYQAYDTPFPAGRIGIGGADDALNQWSGWGAGGNVSSPNRAYWNTTAISVPVQTTGLPFLDGEAEVTAFNPTTIDLNWTSAASQPYKICWVAFKPSTAAGFDGCGGVPQQIYRWLKR